MSTIIKETTFTEQVGYDEQQHTMKLEYSTVTDAFAIYIDGKCVMGGDENQLSALEDLICQVNGELCVKDSSKRE